MVKYLQLHDVSKKQVAPVLCDYVFWVLKEAEARGLQKLYFLARDGYLLKQIAEIICREKKMEITCKYLYCSRASLRMPSYHIIDREEVYDLLFVGGYHVSLKSIFDRAKVPQPERELILQECNFPDTVDLDRELSHLEIQRIRCNFEKSQRFYQIVMQNSKYVYPNTIAYFHQEGLFDQDVVGIVDSGWTGSMQRSLRHLLESDGFRGVIIGFYFGMYAKPKDTKDGEYLCWYFSNDKNKLNKILFCNNLFECFLSAPHGMTLFYRMEKTKVVPVFAPAIDGEAMAQVKEQIDGILEGAALYVKHACQSRKKSEVILHKLMACPTKDVSKIYGKFLFCDDITESYQMSLTGTSQEKELNQYILPNRIVQKFFKKSKSYAELYWPYGTIAQIKNPIKKAWYWINFFICQCLKYTVR